MNSNSLGSIDLSALLQSARHTFSTVIVACVSWSDDVRSWISTLYSEIFSLHSSSSSSSSRSRSADLRAKNAIMTLI